MHGWMRWRGGGRCGLAVTDDLTTLLAVARGLVPAGCGLAVADPRVDRPPFPGESVQGLPKRLAEFRAGRAAAREALAALGLPDRAIPAGADRAPIWPMGVHGAISHSDRLCLAVVGWQRRIGLDLEPATPLEADLRGTILIGAEMGASDLGAKLIFSAKEAVYKAQYPLTRQIIGFESVCVTLTPGHFTAQFLQDVGPIAKGRQVQGRWSDVAGHFLTLAWL